MNIITERLLMRAMEAYDNEMLRTIINDAETEYMLGGWSFPASEKDQNEWYLAQTPRRDQLRCIIVDREKNQTAYGVIMLTEIDYKNGKAEIHIKLSPGEVRGKGIGKEAVSGIVQYAFDELRLNCVYARVNEYNMRSQKMFESCGFEREGILRSRIFKKGQFHNVISYSIIHYSEA